MKRECSYCNEIFGCKDDEDGKDVKTCKQCNTKCIETNDTEITNGICKSCLSVVKNKLHIASPYL